MKEIFDVYKNKLEDFIISLKADIRQQNITKQLLEKVRNELNQWGKNNLNLMFLELRSIADSINVDEGKKTEVLERANSLKEYGLYVAPIDLIKQDDTNAKSMYIGLGAALSALLLQKLLFKKFKFLNSAAMGVLTVFGTKAYVGGGKYNKELITSYIDDAKEWLLAAFENIYKTFEEIET